MKSMNQYIDSKPNLTEKGAVHGADLHAAPSSETN